LSYIKVLLTPGPTYNGGVTLKLSRFLALLLLIPALTGSAQTPSSGSKIISLPVVSPNTPQGTEGGFWNVDGSYEPILRLKNVLLKQSLSVTPILYFADGTPYPSLRSSWTPRASRR
jgi:hypothetical protein